MGSHQARGPIPGDAQQPLRVSFSSPETSSGAERGLRTFGPPQRPREWGLPDLPAEGVLMLGEPGPPRSTAPVRHRWGMLAEKKTPF